MNSVSILIPAYNSEQYIAECIESALKQSYDNYDIVIVDNASIDNTFEICQYYALTNPGKITLHKNETNLGPVNNWLKCAELATGFYCKLLFSDDLLDRKCLSELVFNIDDSCGLVFSSVYIGANIKNAEVHNDQVANRRSLSSLSYIKAILNDEATLSPCACLMRTEDFIVNLNKSMFYGDSNLTMTYGAGPDILLLFITSEQYNVVSYVDKPLVFYRVHNDNLSSNNIVRKSYLKSISEFLYESNYYELYYMYIINEYVKYIKNKYKYIMYYITLYIIRKLLNKKIF